MGLTSARPRPMADSAPAGRISSRLSATIEVRSSLYRQAAGADETVGILVWFAVLERTAYEPKEGVSHQATPSAAQSHANKRNCKGEQDFAARSVLTVVAWNYIVTSRQPDAYPYRV